MTGPVVASAVSASSYFRARLCRRGKERAPCILEAMLRQRPLYVHPADQALLYRPPLLWAYCTRRHPVMAALDPAIPIGCLLSGIASVAMWMRVEMAGSSPAMTVYESQSFRRLV